MTDTGQLLDLQWSQLKHDEAYHKDIVILPVVQRIKHMSLHYAKYSAYFLEAADGGDNQRLTKTLADSFIIALATANALNQDLSRELGGRGTSKGLAALGEEFCESLARDAGDPLWLVRQFVLHNGQLAKACEGWDHLEPLPFREIMKACNLALLKAVLAEAAGRAFDLSAAYRKRIREVESHSMFDEKIRSATREGV